MDRVDAGAPPAPVVAAGSPLVRRSRWPARRAAVLAAALLAAATAVGWRLGRAPSVPPAAADSAAPDASADAARESRLAIFPFALRGGDSTLRYLTDGVVELLAVQLDASGALRLTDARRLAPTVPGRAWELDGARARARAVQADRLVLGTIVATPDRRLQLVADVYDVGGTLRARLTAPPVAERDVYAAVDALARQVVALEAGERAGRLGRVAALTSASLPALRHYLDGERAFSAGRFGDAAGLFIEAVDADSTFALAYFRLALALDWDGNVRRDWTSPRAAARAAALADRLPARERELLLAFRAREAGRAQEAEDRFRQAVVAFPDAVEVWHEWGELRFHSGHELGQPLRSARPMFERVLALTPNNLSAHVHLARIAALEHRTAELDALAGWVERVDPEHESVLELRLLQAEAHGDSARVQALSAAAVRRAAPLDVAAENRILTTAWRAAQFADDPAAALPLLRALDDPRRSAAVRLQSRLVRAHVEAGRGRWLAVDSALAAAEVLDPATGREVRALLAALVAPSGALPPGALSQPGPTGTAGGTPTDEADGASDFSALRDERGLRPVLDPVLRALLATHAGRVTDAEREVARAERAASGLPAAYRTSGQALALEARAELSRVAGDLPGAQKATQAAWALAPRIPSLFGYPLTTRMLRRGALALESGDAGVALKWCEAAEPDIGLGEAFGALVHECRAAARRRLRDPSGAAASARRAAYIWRDADATVRRPEAVSNVRPR